MAFKYGIRVVDTSPQFVTFLSLPSFLFVSLQTIYGMGSYHPSEIILGNCLKALKEEYPRETYKVITKCGQYSSDGFDYSPENIERSVRRSVDRLGCGYLDVVCAYRLFFSSMGSRSLNLVFLFELDGRSS